MISIHALLAESDLSLLRSVMFMALFLSTLSLRRATCAFAPEYVKSIYFYPRSPCGERPNTDKKERLISDISIHALLAESDPLRLHAKQTVLNFYPRSPCGERPAHFKAQTHTVGISIHALLAESDERARQPWQPTAHFYPRSPCGERLPKSTGVFPMQKYFYPRSPCGERLLIAVSSVMVSKFLSTLSLRRATLARYLPRRLERISIHALLAESDSVSYTITDL